MPRTVRAAWTTAFQPDAERRYSRRPIWIELPRMQRRADAGDGADRTVQSCLDDRTRQHPPDLQACPCANTTLVSCTVDRGNQSWCPVRDNRVSAWVLMCGRMVGPNQPPNHCRACALREQ